MKEYYRNKKLDTHLLHTLSYLTGLDLSILTEIPYSLTTLFMTIHIIYLRLVFSLIQAFIPETIYLRLHIVAIYDYLAQRHEHEQHQGSAQDDLSLYYKYETIQTPHL